MPARGRKDKRNAQRSQVNQFNQDTLIEAAEELGLEAEQQAQRQQAQQQQQQQQQLQARQRRRQE